MAGMQPWGIGMAAGRVAQPGGESIRPVEYCVSAPSAAVPQMPLTRRIRYRNPVQLPAEEEPLTAAMLAAATPEEQRRMWAERLYPVVQRMYPELAGQITAMMLVFKNSFLLAMLENDDLRKSTINDIMVYILDERIQTVSLANE